jgi:hypothetical protein
MLLKDLSNKHNGEDCVILTCGPSLIEYPLEKILDFCKNKTVICVKEAIVEYKDICDYFFANSTRHREYDFNEKTIKIFQKCTKPIKFNNYDIILHEDRPFDKKNQLLLKHNFEDYNINNNVKRPWGPGILYESIFYLCKYMGFKNVYTIGWDLIDHTKTHKITHYFDDSNKKEYSTSCVHGDRDYRDEMILVNKNIPLLRQYFKDKKMYIKVVGTKSFVNKEIPRIYL